MATPIRDWRGPHGLWRVLEPTDKRKNGYVVWKAICGGCNRLLTVSSRTLASGSVCCPSCARKANGGTQPVEPHACAECSEPTTRPKYCGEECYRTANARQAREYWRRDKHDLNAIRRASYVPREDNRRVQAAAGRRRHHALRRARDRLVDLLLIDAKRASEMVRDAAAAK